MEKNGEELTEVPAWLTLEKPEGDDRSVLYLGSSVDTVNTDVGTYVIYLTASVPLYEGLTATQELFTLDIIGLSCLTFGTDAYEGSLEFVVDDTSGTLESTMDFILNYDAEKTLTAPQYTVQAAIDYGDAEACGRKYTTFSAIEFEYGTYDEV